MLQEIAITPDVFHTDSYSSREECDSRLEGISETLLEHLLVRNLRNEAWYKELWRAKTSCPFWGQKLLKQLKLMHRLTTFPEALEESPESPDDWCQEALAANGINPLAGILASKEVKESFNSEDLVTSINRCRSTGWWKTASGGGSPRIVRNTAAFMETFGLVLGHASHVMFMDPHLDPGKRDYKDVVKLIESCRNASLIEIHRVCYEGVGTRSNISNLEWERRFKEKLAPVVQQNHLKVEVFIWPNEHDRHLVTNLMSFHLGNGLTTTTDPTAKMTCTRLSRKQSEEIQREVDPNVNRPVHHFLVE